MRCTFHHTPKISDHNTLSIRIHHHIISKEYTQNIRLWKNYNTEKFQNEMKLFNWNYNTNVNCKADALIGNMKSVIDRMCPTKTIKILTKYEHKKWINHEITQKWKKGTRNIRRQ